MDGMVFGGLYVIGVLFLFVMAILWFILPFAIFGTKDKLDDLLAELKKSNRQMESLPELIATAVAAKRERQNEPAAVVVTDKKERKPQPAKETGLRRKQIMEKYGITFDGDKYTYAKYRYDNLKDAVAYAQQQTPGSGE